jgi:hypothetical protein
MFYSARIIQLSVWVDPHDIFGWLFAYANFNFSLQLVSGVVRDYQKFVHGAPSRILSAEQSELIRQAIFDAKLPHAAKLYRQAFPDVAEHEAADFVARLAAELKERHPREFVPQPRFWELNWRAMKICLFAELGALAVIWLLVPSFTAARWPSKLLASTVGFVVGAGCFLPLRLKRLEIGVFITLLCLLSGLIAGWVNFPHADYFYSEGVAFGACLILCGCIRKRRKSTPGQAPGDKDAHSTKDR